MVVVVDDGAATVGGDGGGCLRRGGRAIFRAPRAHVVYGLGVGGD